MQKCPKVTSDNYMTCSRVNVLQMRGKHNFVLQLSRAAIVFTYLSWRVGVTIMIWVRVRTCIWVCVRVSVRIVGTVGDVSVFTPK